MSDWEAGIRAAMAEYKPPEPKPEPIYWYRYEDRRTANYDPWAEYDQPEGYHITLHERKYKFIRSTPKGAWISMDFFHYRDGDPKKFILASATKQFACPTRELALLSYIARKNRQVSILSKQCKDAETARRLGEIALTRLTGETKTIPFHPTNLPSEGHIDVSLEDFFVGKS